MPIKITFTKELTVDLNAYYPQFPRKLKAEIDAAVMALASGEKKPSINGKSYGEVWSDVGDGKRLTNPLREAQLKGAGPGHGVSAAHFAALKKHFGTTPFFMEDAVKFVRKEFPDAVPSSLITNLWRFGHITVQKLEG